MTRFDQLRSRIEKNVIAVLAVFLVWVLKWPGNATILLLKTSPGEALFSWRYPVR